MSVGRVVFLKCGELSSEWGELSSECGTTCLRASFPWGVVLGRVVFGASCHNPVQYISLMSRSTQSTSQIQIGATTLIFKIC